MILIGTYGYSAYKRYSEPYRAVLERRNYAKKSYEKIKIGNTYIGGDSNIAVQSMTNTDTRDGNSTVGEQILKT